MKRLAVAAVAALLLAGPARAEAPPPPPPSPASTDAEREAALQEAIRIMGLDKPAPVKPPEGLHPLALMRLYTFRCEGRTPPIPAEAKAWIEDRSRFAGANIDEPEIALRVEVEAGRLSLTTGPEFCRDAWRVYSEHAADVREGLVDVKTGLGLPGSYARGDRPAFNPEETTK